MNNNAALRISEYLHSLESDTDEQLSKLRIYAAQNNIPIIRMETESFIRTMLKLMKPQSILELGTAIGYSSIVMAKACKTFTESTAGTAEISVRDSLETISEAGGDIRDSFKLMSEAGQDTALPEKAADHPYENAAALTDDQTEARKQTEIITVENYAKRIPLARENIQSSGMAEHIRLIEGDAGEVLEQLVRDGRSFDLIFLDAAKGQYPVWLPDIMRLMHTGSVLLADNVLQECTVCESRYTIPRRERTTHERMREFLYTIKHDARLESTIMNIGDGISMSVML